jgi:hypothetical protein
LKIGKADVRAYKRLTGNAVLIEQPKITQQFEGKPVKKERTIAKSHWKQVGTGEVLTVETILKDSQGNVVPLSAAVNILENYKSVALNEKAEKIDKKKLSDFILNQDGSIGESVMPFPTTERIEVLESANDITESGQGYWVPSTFMEGFLIHEVYELSAADPRNDTKLFKEADEALKRDEIALCTFSNGGYKQYYGFLVPHLEDGKFVWLLKLSDKKVEYNNLREIPAPAAALKPAPKTVQTLPPLQAMLTIPTRK